VIGWLAGLRIRVEGRAEKAPVLLLANHLSWLDILALAGACRTVFAGKDALAGHPFLKWLCEQNRTIFLQRDRRHTVAQQVTEVRDAMSHRPLTLFPEGTTSNGMVLLPFKSSLLAAIDAEQMTVQPVALDYAEAPTIAWGEEPVLANAWRILSRTRPIHLTIRFLPPLAGAVMIDRKTMAIAAQQAIAESLRL
jgi:1-acyl-sn-glycerol-3-phosphate acyltransferase